ncbi:MAG TPA: EF-hand domain-containing protein [Xanthobacteraceae bacterium]|jgi:Ca2+-binding EF-hand superfamily protein
MSGPSGIGGGLAPSVIKQFQQNLFSQIDADGNGSVSKTELEQAVTKAGGGTQAADALYSVLDPGSSGGFGEQQLAQVLPGAGFSDQMQAQMIGYQAQGWPGASGPPGAQLAQSLFAQIDSNGDGSISQAELEQAVTNAGGTKEAADALYAKLDPQNTGSVSEDQLAQGLSQAMPHHHHHHHGAETGAAGTSDGSGGAAGALASLFNADGGGAGNSPTQIAQNMFAQTDLNGDGAITQSELEQSVTAAGGDKAGADALFAKLDPNGTGSVTQQQFLDALQPPSATGNTADDALLALIKGSSGAAASPAATPATAAFNSADLARAFALYQNQLAQQLMGGIGATQNASLLTA